VFKRLHLGTVSFAADSMDEVCTVYPKKMPTVIFLITLQRINLF